MVFSIFHEAHIGVVIGIDLGTTKTCLAIMDDGKPRAIPNADGAGITPSMVAFADDELLVGMAARRQAVTNPDNTLFGIRRLIERKFDDVSLCQYKPFLPYRLIEGINGDAWFDVKNTSYPPNLILAFILQSIKVSAEAYLGEEVTQAVITAPAYFTDNQRKAINEAGTIAGLEVLRIISDSVAAALAYGFNKVTNKTIAIYDLGGGALDISILEFDDGLFEVKSTNGDTFLGGEDFDMRIVEYLASEFKIENGIDLTKDKMALQRLKEAAEKAKIELSATVQTEINQPFISMDSETGQPLHMVMKLTRAKLESLVSDLIKRTLKPCMAALRDACLSKGDIDEIILVGGMTRMPKVREDVSHFFGQEPRKSVNSGELVAMGAAIQAGMLQGDVKDVVLLDVTPLSLGIETFGGVFTRLIDRNTTIPTKKSHIFSTAEDNQNAVTIRIFQGEREMATDNKMLGKFNLEHIPPAPRGVPQIQVDFDIDPNSVLFVRAKDKKSGRAQKVTVEPFGGLSNGKIKKLALIFAKLSDAQKQESKIEGLESDIIDQSYSLSTLNPKYLDDIDVSMITALEEELLQQEWELEATSEEILRELEAAVSTIEILAQSHSISSNSFTNEKGGASSGARRNVTAPNIEVVAKHAKTDCDENESLDARRGVGVQNTKQTFRPRGTKSVIVNTKRKRVVVPAPGRSAKAEGASSRSTGIPNEEMERRLKALNAAKAREAEDAARRESAKKSGSEMKQPPDASDLRIGRPLVAPKRHYDNKPMVETGRKRVVTPARGGTAKAAGAASNHKAGMSDKEMERRRGALNAAQTRESKNTSDRVSEEKPGHEKKQVSDNQSQKRLGSKTKQNEQPYPGYLESQQGGAVALSELYGAMLEYSDGVLSGRLFDPRKGEDDPTGLLFAISVLRDAVHAPPENLLPLMPVCENSFACAVCDRDIADENSREAYEVVRWHLGLVDERAQGELLDVDALSFLNSMAEELNDREAERKKVDRTSERYYTEYVVKGRRPSVGQLRPVQLACQNVIIGLASLRHDPVFDGLRVEAYASCEAPHLATGEADRAMAGLLLCDAFQSGGTMEVRFGTTRKEMHVPPALRRFARVRGLTLGANDHCSISPAEARELFLAVTPMSDELRVRTFEAFDGGIISPERFCYTLMAGVWSQIELGYFLATTARTASILVGGAGYTDRLTRSAEQEICRAALMSGMLLRRFENASDDEDQASGVDVIEDQRVGTEWAIRSEIGAVAYEVQSGQPIPWTTKPYGSEDTSDHHGTLIVVPRGMPLSCDFELIHALKEEMPDASVKLLVPADADLGSFSEEMSLRCPWSLAELDQETRRRLDKLRIARK